MNTEANTPPKKSFKIQMLAARETAIIQSVNRLLAEKGFDAMTVDEVAAEVGIAKASLYKHFTSKEELACAAMVTAMRKAQEHIQSLSAEKAAIDKLKAVTRWTMTLKLQGLMPSLPSQNSSLRATLMASKDYMDGLMPWAAGSKRHRRKGKSTRPCLLWPCSTPCLLGLATRCWSSSRWANSTPTNKSSIW
jgi:AcrR family transcriptional regulator